MGSKIIMACVFYLGMISCNQLSQTDYSSDANKSGPEYIKSKTVDWLNIEAFMKPASHLLKRFVNRSPATFAEKEDFQKDLARMIYFDLRLSVNTDTGANIENYNTHSQFDQDQRIHYLAFSMKNDIYLEQDALQIPCEIYHFERNYSLSPHRTFTLGFPRKMFSQKKPIALVFDSQYFRTGPLKIQYTAKDFSDALQIEL